MRLFLLLLRLTGGYRRYLLTPDGLPYARIDFFTRRGAERFPTSYYGKTYSWRHCLGGVEPFSGKWFRKSHEEREA